MINKDTVYKNIFELCGIKFDNIESYQEEFNRFRIRLDKKDIYSITIKEFKEYNTGDIKLNISFVLCKVSKTGYMEGHQPINSLSFDLKEEVIHIDSFTPAYNYEAINVKRISVL